YLARLYLAENPELVKTDQDLSFKIPLTSSNIIDKEEKLESQESLPEAKVELFSWLPREARVGQAIFVNLFGKTQPAHSFQLKFYLDLLDGNRQRLQVLLKEHFGHMTTNKTFMVRTNQLNSSTPLSTQVQLSSSQAPMTSSSASILNKLLL
ncbi:unnamed protein product, partial [Didymodactylos carnosus]